jgi:hypothetical protein
MLNQRLEKKMDMKVVPIKANISEKKDMLDLLDQARENIENNTTTWLFIAEIVKDENGKANTIRIKNEPILPCEKLAFASWCINDWLHECINTHLVDVDTE